MDWENQLEAWRKAKKLYDDTEEKNKQSLKDYTIRLDKQNNKLYNLQKEVNDKTTFITGQLKKMELDLKDLFKDTPTIERNSTDTRSLTGVSLYTKNSGNRSAEDFIKFDFGLYKVEVSPGKIFDKLLYPIQNTAIMRVIVPFKPPTQELVEQVQLESMTDNAGSCDVCGHTVILDSKVEYNYFPMLSTSGGEYWCCQFCKKFLHRYLKEVGMSHLIEKVIGESSPSGIKLSEVPNQFKQYKYNFKY